MKFRLRNKELQKQLDEISNGDFSQKLETEARRRFVGVLNREIVSVYYGDFDALANRFSAIFEIDEVEEAPEYDPHNWNEWPEVEPPINEKMMVEVKTKDGITVTRACAKFSGKTWCTFKIEDWKDCIVYFRPWVGPGEKENNE